MTLEQLRIFVFVAERLHMTRAAEALGLTQSAVSAAVAALETRYGVRLFDRVGRGLALTEAGRVFLPEATAVLLRARVAQRLNADQVNELFPQYPSAEHRIVLATGTPDLNAAL